MDDKSIDITVIAILKSVIESGADSKDWHDLTKEGLMVWFNSTDFLKQFYKENK